MEYSMEDNDHGLRKVDTCFYSQIPTCMIKCAKSDCDQSGCETTLQFHICVVTVLHDCSNHTSNPHAEQSRSSLGCCCGAASSSSLFNSSMSFLSSGMQAFGTQIVSSSSSAFLAVPLSTHCFSSAVHLCFTFFSCSAATCFISEQK